MKLAEIQKLMQAFEDSEAREFDLTDGDFHLYLSKNKHPKASAPMPVRPAPVAPVDQPAPAKADQAAPSPAPAAEQIKAPLVGTVYLQPKPGAKPYVAVGDQVKEGDVVCVIEAMKMMTEVKSKLTGTIKRVLVEDEQLVEVDQPLFEVE